jgi:putative oxidoreductase
MTSVALLILRVTVGGLLAGHGAQKLFGSFGGHGVEGTAGWLESMNLKPGRQWAFMAGLSEFGGGMLTALGALNPIGPIMALGAMLMATVKVHAGRPIWVTEGGAELPVTNMAAQAALILAGPGRLSFDGLLGIRIPRWFGLAALVATVIAVIVGVTSSEQSLETTGDQQDQAAGQELQGEGSDPAGTQAGASGSSDDGQTTAAWDDPAVAAMARPEA